MVEDPERSSDARSLDRTDRTDMTLASIFQQYAAPALWEEFRALPDLEGALLGLVQAGLAEGPPLGVTPEQFVQFLARHLPAEAASPKELAALRARELYLVCALGHGDRVAHEILDTQYLTKVRQALQRLGALPHVIEDIQQELCRRLLEMQDPAISRRGYAGRSDLANWLCLTAIREAYQQHQRVVREPQLDAESVEVLLDEKKDPETALLSSRYKADFQAAFRDAIASLTSRERNLLRYHYLSKLSIDQIGNLYHVHRVTAFRWVTRAQERMVSLTRERFFQRAPMSPDSLPYVMELIHSQLSVNLGNELKQLAESEPPSA